VKKSKQKED